MSSRLSNHRVEVSRLAYLCRRVRKVFWAGIPRAGMGGVLDMTVGFHMVHITSL